MTEYQEIVRRLKRSQAIRAIQRETGIHRTLIRRIWKISDKEGWLDPGSQIPSEEVLYQVFNSDTIPAVHPLEAWKEQIKEWVENGYSYVVIHKLINPQYECSEATVRRYVKKNFPTYRKTVMRRETIAGEIMEVDFAYLGITYDPASKKNRKTYLFSGRLRHSRDAYREIVFNQKQDIFFECHTHSFEYFGGVPLKVVPDNLKAAVIKASFESPVVNRVYRKLAEHYNFMISPCLPGIPEHKGGVENDIKYVKRNFWPLFKEYQKEKGNLTPNASELKEALVQWNDDTARIRKIGGIGRSPDEIFRMEEKQALQPLPDSRWQPLEWACGITVQDTCRIQYKKAFYSIPYKYNGKKVDVLSDLHSVYIFFDHQQIVLHKKAEFNWTFIRKSEHFPPHQEEYMRTTRESLKAMGKNIGLYSGMIIAHILDNKHIDGLRPARAILFGLRKKYGDARLEASSQRAWIYDTPEYNSVKSILQKELDKVDIKKPVDSVGQQLFQFARGPGYFDPANHQDAEGETVWTK